MAFWAQILALLTRIVATAAIKEVPLDMAHNSFDDRYLNCGPAMTEALPALNVSEFQENPLFAQAWLKATAEWQKRGSYSSPLTKDQAIALMVYTMKSMYKLFNEAVREAGRTCQEYRHKFHFKTSSEFQENQEFSHAWKKAMAEWQKRGSYTSTLTKDQAIALMVYTMTYVYRDFNEAVQRFGSGNVTATR
ncbi:unnamed protein product [Coccothraustes coccothraustes]